MFKVMNGKTHGFVGKNKIYIGRNSYQMKGSILGNKFSVKKYGREGCIAKYKEWLWNEVKKGEGKVYDELVRIGEMMLDSKENIELVCWCSPLGCHGDIIKSCIEWMIKEGLIMEF